MTSRYRLFRAAAATLTCLAAAPAVAQSPVPSMRALDGVVPSHYDLRLTLDPNAETYAGTLDIRVRLAAPIDLIWINATQITFDDVRAAIDAEPSGELPGEVVPGNDDFAGIRFSRTLPAGEATLRFRFKARFSDSEIAGLFRQRQGDDWYVLTQMEPMYARRAFPCFDDPRFRASWQVTVTIPANQRAFSNMPASAERDAAPGWRELSFAPTPPIASYLVAISVGPWDVLDGGVAGRNRTPLRYIAPKGRASEAAYAATVTPAILERLEAYFGRPYPFPKLDSLSIPNSGHFFGAMENIGLITYDQSILLATPGETTTRFQQRYVAISAHEISHQWFGNLVTPAWWNDIWLNESFASWLGDKITSELKPEWHWDFRRVDARQWAIANDRLASARRVRQPIEARSDVRSAFDGISYSKGASLLAMYENWLGPDKFRDGVRRYMDRHAWGVATADDFFAALAAADDAMLPSFRGFVDRAGVPELAIRLDCAGGHRRLALTQSRFAPKGSTIDDRQRWVFPACFQYGDDHQGKVQCMLVRDESTELALDTKTCPSWVVANRAGIGYFLPALSSDLYSQLPRAKEVLAPLDWVSLLADTETLARGAALALPTALALAAFASEMSDPRTVRAAVEIANSVPRALTEGAKSNRYAAWSRRSFGRQARALGWQMKPDEDADTQRLRRRLVPYLADRGEDAALARDAQTRALRWPNDPAAISPDIRGELLYAAARTSTRDSRALYAHLTAEAGRTNEARTRREILYALGGFRDRSLAAEAANLMLAGAFDPQDALHILAGQLENDDLRASALTWLDHNYDALAARGARDNFDRLPGWAEGACTPGERKLFVAALADRMPYVDGGPRSYAKALERIDLCIANRDAQAPALTAWLAAGAPIRPIPQESLKLR
jgi:cytosol alanyl aminopeptidase